MISLHFPPDSDNDTFLSVTDQKNACLYLLYSKLGLAKDAPAEMISWTERFYLKTSISNRESNQDRPYEAVWDQATLDVNARLNIMIDRHATYWVRLFLAKPNVLEDIARAQEDPDWRLFTLTFDEGNFVPIYQQPFHGAVNIKTGQFHLYVFHCESVLRHSLSDTFLRLADMTINLFAALLGITTIHKNGFAKFTTSSITDPSLWKTSSENGKHSNVLKAVILMRWVEKTYDHRFHLSQLSQALLYYAEKEDLILDDNAEDTPICQLNKHMSSKSGKIAANKIRPDGTKQLDYMRDLNQQKQRELGQPVLTTRNEVQRSLGWPNLKKANEVQRANGFPQLAANREAQRAAGVSISAIAALGLETQCKAGFPNLVKANAERQARFHDKLQLAVEATNKRKQDEDPAFVPPPAKKFEQRSISRKRGTIPCTFSGCKSKLMTDESLQQHLRNQHGGGFSEEAPHKCPLDTCGKYFRTQGLASDHHRKAHAPKVTCPECSKEFVERALKPHRRDHHGVDC